MPGYFPATFVGVARDIVRLGWTIQVRSDRVAGAQHHAHGDRARGHTHPQIDEKTGLEKIATSDFSRQNEFCRHGFSESAKWSTRDK